jgi:F-type H+-transporting ATPase subunit gamma
MPSIKDLKKRIASTKNTQQTTRAMKMVSAAKLRRAQDAILAQRPYARRIGELIRNLLAVTEFQVRSDLLGRELPEGARKKVLLLVVASDRGLCGGFNSNVIKAVQRWLLANGADCESVTLSFLGRRGYEFFRTKGLNVGKYYAELGGKVTFEKANRLTQDLVASYQDGTYDEIKVVYNEFKNAISQKVQVETLLPLSELRGAFDAPASSVGQEFLLVRPGPQEVFEELLQKHLPTQTFRIMLESQASEHGARMSAMENATKNAGEMIRKLTLQFNKQRQAGITKELLEIIAGSESQKGA